MIRMKAHVSNRECFLVALVLCILPGCTKHPNVVSQWSNAQLGMERSDIKRLFGEPSGKQGPATLSNTNSTEDMSFVVAAGLGGALLGSLDEYWEYGPPNYVHTSPDEIGLEDLERLSPEQQQQFSEAFWKALLGGPSEDAFIVVFDSRGTVQELRAPRKGRYAHLPTRSRNQR